MFKGLTDGIIETKEERSRGCWKVAAIAVEENCKCKDFMKKKKKKVKQNITSAPSANSDNTEMIVFDPNNLSNT